MTPQHGQSVQSTPRAPVPPMPQFLTIAAGGPRDKETKVSPAGMGFDPLTYSVQKHGMRKRRNSLTQRSRIPVSEGGMMRRQRSHESLNASPGNRKKAMTSNPRVYRDGLDNVRMNQIAV
jgi:hypothetical protein